MKKKNNQVVIVDPKSIISAMEAKMPTWVKDMNNKEDMANATYAAAQEMLLAVLDTLRRYHKFKDQDLKDFSKELEDLLQGTKEFETHGLSILTPHSMDVIGEKVQQVGIAGLLAEISQTRLIKEKVARAGIEYPITLQAVPYLKKLKEKNQ